MSKESFVKAVIANLPEKLWLACIGQAIAESGIADTKLANEHNNFHGMKWRTDEDFKKCMTGINCKGFTYYTDSEPTGSAEFIEFATVADGVKGWLAFLNRSPYVSKDLTSSSALINSVGPVWCPPGQLDGYKNSHGGRNYQQQIIQVHFLTAQKLIEQYKSEPEPMDVTWHNAHILIDEKTRQMEIGLASYAGDKLRSLGRFSVDSGLLSSYLSKFPSAKNIVKAEPTKAWPGEVPVDPVDPVEPFVEIKVGDSGERVEDLQEQINRVFTDITLVTDGKFGPATEDAVKKFCTKAGIAVSGIVNESCWKALVATKSESLTWEKVTPGQKLLTIPWATRVADFKTSWTYDKGYPSGLIVHFTATGPSAAQEKGVEDYMRKNWSVFQMNRNGTLLQTFPLNRGGYHCGTVHHDTCLGVEIVAAGRCTKVTLDGKTKYAPWYAYADDGNGSYLKYPSYCFDDSEMRYSGPSKVKNIYSGMYQKYTQAQEETLIKLCLWLKEQAPDIFSFDKVLGHDEACDVGGRPGAKNDPGAALSMDMPAFRQLLKDRWAARNN